MLNLLHYSNHKGLKYISPDFMGTGQIGAERAQIDYEQKKMFPGYLRKSCWYVPEDNKVIELHRFRHKPKYSASIDLDTLYIVNNTELQPTDVELRNRGFVGYYNPYFGQVRLFIAKTVLQEQ